MLLHILPVLHLAFPPLHPLFPAIGAEVAIRIGADRVGTDFGGGLLISPPASLHSEDNIRGQVIMSSFVDDLLFNILR